MIRKIFLLLVLSLSIILLSDSSNSIGSQSYSQLQLDATRVPWVDLHFKTKSFWVDVTSHLHLEPKSADEVKASLVESKQGDALEIPVAGSYKLSSDTIIDSILQPPVEISNLVWFDSKDATALGRTRLRRGEDDFKKTYRFTRQGVFRHRREPMDQEEAQKDPEQWTDVVDTFYPHNLSQLGCPNVSERLLLVYIASAFEQLDDDKPLFLCIFGKRQLFEVQLKSAGLHSVKIDFVEKKHQNEQRRKGQVKAHKIELQTRPLESALEKVENFSFLGFHKDIAFFLDPASRLPIQVTGKIPTVGKATLKLQEVQLR